MAKPGSQVGMLKVIRNPQLEATVCASCGSPFMYVRTTRPRTRCEDCGGAQRTYCLERSRQLGPVARKPLDEPIAQTCPECDVVFSTRHRGRLYCSKRCGRRVSKRARRAGGTMHLLLANVGDRDLWTCHLCGLFVDRALVVPSPFAPTMDHVIPVSRGGLHTYGNVRLAHFSCNTRRGVAPLWNL